MPLLWILFVLALPARADKLEFCGPGRQPSLTFREVYVDHLDPLKRTQELWMDPADDALRGYWRQRGKAPTLLIGNSTEEGRFFLCEYAWGGKKAKKLFFGDKKREELTINGQKLKRLRYRPELRDYMLKYDMRTIIHDDPRFLDGPRCSALYAYFQIIAPKLSPGQKELNEIVMDGVNASIALDAEGRECLSRTALPRQHTVAANVLFANQKYISIKLDQATVAQNGNDFGTQVINFDLADSRRMDRGDLFSKTERDTLFKFVKKRLIEIQGKNSLEDLEGVSFAWTADTLIVSLFPFETVDIPITLDTLNRVLNITGKAPIRP